MFKNFWYPVALVSQLPEGTSKITLGGHQIWVERTGDNFAAYPSHRLHRLIAPADDQESLPVTDTADHSLNLATQENYGLLFVFLGENGVSCPCGIPVIPEVQDESWRMTSGSFLWNADYTRALENAIDVQHPFMVHPHTFGNPARPEVNAISLSKEEWSGAQSSRFFPPDNPVQRLLRRGVPDALTRVSFHMPNMTRLDVTLPGMEIVIVSFHSPVCLGVTNTYWLMLRNSFKSQCFDGLTKFYVENTFKEDERIVTRQFPVQTPFLTSTELSVKQDALQLHFRALCRKCAQLGWLLDPV